MQITNVNQIKDGMKVFFVHKFSDVKNFMIPYRIIKDLFVPNSVLKYVKVDGNEAWLFVNAFNVDARIPAKFSLRDCGVIPNNYNQHRLFDNEQEAIEYMEE